MQLSLRDQSSGSDNEGKREGVGRTEWEMTRENRRDGVTSFCTHGHPGCLHGKSSGIPDNTLSLSPNLAGSR